MRKRNIRDYLLYCGTEKNNYCRISPLIWERNASILKITAAMAAAMGPLFIIINRFTGSDVWFPYLFLFCGSMMILSTLFIVGSKAETLLRLILCYGEMILMCVYASILSTQEVNRAIPATSVIVFIALLPQSINDRPIRMYAVMICESAAYLTVSYLKKDGHAFQLDLMNALTFLLIGMALYSVICTRNVREIYQNLRVEKIQRRTISTLATVVEERDESTGGHIQRTEDLVSGIISRMKKQDKYSSLDSDYCKNVILAAPMHDIGKIRIPDAILNKPGRLDEAEYEIMKKHAEYGAEIITRTMKGVEEREYCDIAFNIARHHHERYDGTGYPDVLKGEDIPLEARIMAIADVYDALVSERVYKKPFPKEQAIQIIKEGAGTQFDPELVAVFLECVK